MPSVSPSQRIAEISSALKILRTQSLSHLDKAAEISAKALDELLASLKRLTTLGSEGA